MPSSIILFNLDSFVNEGMSTNPLELVVLLFDEDELELLVVGV